MEGLARFLACCGDDHTWTVWEPEDGGDAFTFCLWCGERIQDGMSQDRVAGDRGWLDVHRELADLHVSKARDYGTDEDALANYVLTSEAVGEPDEYTCWLRIHEKCVRALNLLRAGRGDENVEGPDVAALAIGAEALRRRRTL